MDHRKHTTFRLLASILALLAETAKKEQRSRGVIVEQAIRLYAETTSKKEQSR